MGCTGFRRLLMALSTLLLLGCAHQAPQPAVQALLAGARFEPRPEPDPQALFALSPAMHDFMNRELRSSVRAHGPQRGLYRALSEGGHLRIDYDASQTRTAAETFEARAGNCMSLMLMTASLARELGLRVNFQLVEVAEIWTLSERFIMLNGHVNLSLGEPPRSLGFPETGRIVIDFQPIDEAQFRRVRVLSEQTAVAMFFNNRAVELMEQGDADGAFAHLRAAMRADPGYLNGLNTLGVLFRRSGDPARAEASLKLLLELEPHNRNAAANLAGLWREQGRVAEAQALERELPSSPFADYAEGMKRAGEGRWADAVEAFERQLRRSPDFHGLHFQLARAHLQLGHVRQARQYLEFAHEQAPTIGLRQRYQSKVEALRRAS